MVNALPLYLCLRVKNDGYETSRKMLKRRVKRERDNHIYFIDSYARVDRFFTKVEMEREILSNKEKKDIRNRVSSMIARIRNREEKIFIRKIIERKDEMMQDVIQSISKFGSSD